MIELKGKYAQAKIFTDVVDEASVAQVLLLLNQEFISGSTVRLMPDIHAGAGCTVGTTMTITDKTVPNLVGVDIGCGMETVKIKEKHIELQKLDKLIYEKIPSGFNIRDKAHKFFKDFPLEELYCYKEITLSVRKKA
ncbi:MAG: RtcB family protein, partial [[Eubacterium] siraeum]|nr:RtcB family protein [[Eubacterium] siraeum]